MTVGAAGKPESPRKMRRSMSSVSSLPRDDFQEQCLTAHNKVRAQHQGQPLTFSDDLLTAAKNWAETLAERGFLQHSESQSYGENIMITDEDISAEEVVERWAAEEEKYDYDQARWQKGTTHFTQMVWRISTEFGIYKTKMTKKDRYVIVATYKALGNTNRPGDYSKNVLPKE
ncbi:Golgi-associated plant pathogenesis-related protein 1-like [Amphiura filiformis]|uniref:Golgi-associated plant pathogenesis-related protein 1-like n=1 Tax=Amphiura filiformis TaxID=82378 RepID=UPI003B20DF9B